LKCFYFGTPGNEKVQLTKSDWEWLEANAQDEELDGILYKKNCEDVINKLREIEKSGNNGEKRRYFNQLHLVLGRRASKTIMASIITAYEVYKLLVINKGDPHTHYGIPYSEPIVVINVALSQKQAGHLFGAISNRLEDSPFFKDKIARGTTQEIGLYTERELKKIRESTSKLAVPAPIKIICGHSNPKTLRGYNAILLLFDELAFYDDTGKVTGSQFYDDLKPSISKFAPYGDGKIVCISSPNAMTGIFHDLFSKSKGNKGMLAFQLPTWCVNTEVTYESLEQDRLRNPEKFAVEYGGQFSKSGTMGEYFPADLVDYCVKEGIIAGCAPMKSPDPKYHYYLHIDPAKNNDKYTAVMIAREIYRENTTRGEKRIRIRLANIWQWEPTPGMGLIFKDIDNDIIQICRKFRPRMVTYDSWNSIHSLQYLRKSGVRCLERSYNASYKMKIYQNLRDLMAHQPKTELLLYDDTKLILEMKSLKFRPTKRGYTLVKDKAEGINDDIIDCLAGASSEALHIASAPLPTGGVVNLGRLR
jgi:hypothetical protein